jgi:protein-disulfide isomerase
MSQNFFRFFVVGLLLIIAASVYRYADRTVLTESGAISNEKVASIVEETLLKKPELVIQAADQYRKTLEQKENDDRQSAVSTVKPELDLAAKSFPVLGNPEAAITIYEFLDYNCGYCKMVTAVINKIVDQHNDVRFVILDAPILSPSSEDAARAALAANKQGKFKALHDALMEHKGALSKEVILGIAKRVGLDVEKLKTDMTSDEVSKTLDASRTFAQRLKLNGTPSFLIGDEFIPGALGEENLLKKIEDLRQAGSPKKN